MTDQSTPLDRLARWNRLAGVDTVVSLDSISFFGGLDAGARWAIPEWADYIGGGPTDCRSCGARILFVRSLRTGKLAPLDPDGTSHFATCPEAAAWRRTRGAPPRPAATTSPVGSVPADGMSRVLRASDEAEAS